MTAIVSTVFRVIYFPHESNIVTIDQLDYFKHDLNSSFDSTIPMIINSLGNQLNIIGVGMYPSLMGSFNLAPPSQLNPVFAISQVANENESHEVSFQNHYLNDSWMLPDPRALTQGEGFKGMASPLSAVEIYYLDITTDEGQSLPEREEVDRFNSPTWILDSPMNTYPINIVLPSDEAIMEAMTETKRPWGDLHHISCSLLNLKNMQEIEKDLKNSVGYGWFCNSVTTHEVFAEGNMSNILKTIPINISKTHGVVENVLIRANYSPQEIELYTTLFK